MYKDFSEQDTFSDRLLFFLIHFAFFLKVYKNQDNKKILQDIFDSCFRELELSIREIGYGDQSINKRMKNYLNIFYDIINKIDSWESIKDSNKKLILSSFLNNRVNIAFLVMYFDNYVNILSNNTLNSYIKGVVKH